MRWRRSIFRVPSIRGRISARTSWKRYVRQNMGLKAPRGYGWLTDPKRALYNRVYNRTSIGCMVLPMMLAAILAGLAISQIGQRSHKLARAFPGPGNCIRKA